MLTACTVGPEYVRPAAPVPASYKWEEGWREARPADALERGAWWSVFSDPALDALMRQVEISNQNVAAAEAAFRNAAAAVAEARAAFFPDSRRECVGGARSRGSRAAPEPATMDRAESAMRSAPPGRRAGSPICGGAFGLNVTNAAATAQASAADLAAARLAAQAQLATAYMQIRVLDELRRLLDASVKAYAELLRISENQYNAGIVSAADVAQARTQSKARGPARSRLAIQRGQLENAIAVLIGKPPSELSISPAPGLPVLPEIPAGLPSSLLERRPDIAAAERRMAAANAAIGVAATAFYPDIRCPPNPGSPRPRSPGWFRPRACSGRSARH